MNQDDHPLTANVSRPEHRADPRKERLAAALRDNLKRRKQQMRGRKAGESPAQTAGETAGQKADQAALPPQKQPPSP